MSIKIADLNNPNAPLETEEFDYQIKDDQLFIGQDSVHVSTLTPLFSYNPDLGELSYRGRLSILKYYDIWRKKRAYDAPTWDYAISNDYITNVKDIAKEPFYQKNFLKGDTLVLVLSKTIYKKQ